MNLEERKSRPARPAKSASTGSGSGRDLGLALQSANGLIPAHAAPIDDGVDDRSTALFPASLRSPSRQKRHLWVFAPSKMRCEDLASQLGSLRDLLPLVHTHSAASLEALVTGGSVVEALPARSFVLVDTQESPEAVARFARQCLRGRSRLGMIFLAECARGEDVDQILQAGARGVIPRSYDATGLTGALRVILSGHRFRPYAHTVPTPLQVCDAGTLASGAILAHQAEQPLSAAELDVCRLVAQHLSDREIAEIRGTRRGTVRSQVTNIMRKLGCKRRDEAGEVYRRLHEVDDGAVQRALAGDTAKLDWLLEFMDVERARKGQVLFRRGQTAQKLYYLEKGQVRLTEIDAVMEDGVLFGEIGIFKPDQKRMHTAECLTDVDLRTLQARQVWRYYQLKPQFAVLMLGLITRRLLADIERLRR